MDTKIINNNEINLENDNNEYYEQNLSQILESNLDNNSNESVNKENISNGENNKLNDTVTELKNDVSQILEYVTSLKKDLDTLSNKYNILEKKIKSINYNNYNNDLSQEITDKILSVKLNEFSKLFKKLSIDK